MEPTLDNVKPNKKENMTSVKDIYELMKSNGIEAAKEFKESNPGEYEKALVEYNYFQDLPPGQQDKLNDSFSDSAPKKALKDLIAQMKKEIKNN